MKIKDIMYEDYIQRNTEMPVVVFGTGGQMREAMDVLPILSRVEAFVDNDENKQGTILSVGDREIPVYGPEYLSEERNEEFELLIAVRDYMSVIVQCNEIEKLKDVECYIYHYVKPYPELGTEEFYTKRVVEPCLEIYEYNLKIRGTEEKEVIELVNKEKNKLYELDEEGSYPVVIPELVVILTTKCTLNCKYCAGMMPYIPKYDISFEQIKKDVDRVIEAVDEWMQVQLIGGEPFLYPDFYKVLTMLIDNPKIKYISIVTNGTIIPNSDIVELCRNNKVSIRISKYPVKHKIEELVSILEEKNITYILMEDMAWVDFGKNVYSKKTSAQLKNLYLKCDVGRDCKTLENGYIYGCGRIARLVASGMKVEEHDYVHISDNKKKNREEIGYIYANMDYLKSCSICERSMANMRIIPSGEQLKK